MTSENASSTVMRLGITLDWWCSDTDAIQKTIDTPEFEDAGSVHDWRNYVPEWAQEKWSELPTETKLVIYLMAGQQAHNEEWD